MKTQILAVWMMFAVVGGARIEAAEPRAEPDAGTVTGTALCRAQPGAGQTATVPKQTADAARASCTALTEAIGKCVHLENTVIWLGVWQQAQAHFVDHERGGWHSEVDGDGRPVLVTWDGKPDLYHVFQATLYPRLSLDQGLAAALTSGR